MCRCLLYPHWNHRLSLSLWRNLMIITYFQFSVMSIIMNYGCNIVLSLQLHLWWIIFITRHLHNLMKVGLRVSYWTILEYMATAKFFLIQWNFPRSLCHVQINLISQTQLTFLLLKVYYCYEAWTDSVSCFNNWLIFVSFLF